MIAYDLGFKSPAHFTRMFKNAAGVLPANTEKKPDRIELMGICPSR